MKALKIVSILFTLVSSVAISQPFEGYPKKEENEYSIKYIDIFDLAGVAVRITECTKNKNNDSIECIQTEGRYAGGCPIRMYSDGEVALGIYNALKQKYIKYQLDRTLVKNI